MLLSTKLYFDCSLASSRRALNRSLFSLSFVLRSFLSSSARERMNDSKHDLRSLVLSNRYRGSKTNLGSSLSQVEKADTWGQSLGQERSS